VASDDRPIGQRQYLTFFLGDEQYAVGVLGVKEIIEYGIVTKVPATPPYIRGVINLRGSVVPVVDLSVKFNLTVHPVSRRTCIVIMETTILGERATMGIVADSVNQVIEFSPQDIEAAPAFGTGIRLEYLEGMAKIGTKFVLVLNMAEIFAAADTSVLPAAGTQTAQQAAAAAREAQIS
jgi:purine-binding chemotaxis protein CheW